MRFNYLRLENYIGIYNGLGLNQIHIDFTKCKHTITVIKGRNGSGKSTLFNALHPLPDSNDNFIPKAKAMKHLGIYHNGFNYDIVFIHDINSRGERETTKAYISKGGVEANPNGNVTSYKDYIFSEFNLDSNFIELSQLSSGKRGLADKKPLERKKFIGSIINKVDIYNNMLKTLTKKSSVMKSMITNITAKLDSLGNRESLISKLELDENQLKQLEIDKNNITERIAIYKSSISIKDPNNKLINTYNELDSKLNNNTMSIKFTNNNLINEYGSTNITLEEANNEYNRLTSQVNDFRNAIVILESQLASDITKAEEQSNQLNIKSAKLLSLNTDINYEALKKSINDNKQTLEAYDKIIIEMGIDKNNLLSKDEYIIGLELLKDIKNTIDIFRSEIEYDIIKETIEEYINKPMNFIPNKIEELTKENNLYTEQLKLMSALNLRPDKCKINTCEFIKEALKVYNSLNTDENFDMIQKRLVSCVNTNNHSINRLKKIYECHTYLIRILRDLNNHKNILSKLPNKEIYINQDIFLTRILNHYHFTDIDTLYQYIDSCNILDDYNAIKNTLYKLEVDYKIYESKNELITEIMDSINELDNSLKQTNIEVENKKSRINELKDNIITFEKNISKFNNIIQYLIKKNELEKENIDINSKLHDITDEINSIKSDLEEIRILESKLKDISVISNPLMQERDILKHKLMLYDEYINDYNQFKAKFDKIETIKTFVNPSDNNAIQLIFINMYMDTMLDMANRLLALLFNGEYQLLPFDFTDGFKIPCIGTGMRNDDISSMSTSQISMIGMILSFVLLQQSSTSYNIIRLDEIDGGLDYDNRIKFISLLDEIMRILQCEQGIIITHNSEMDLSNCDIIQLKQDGNDSYNGNIIYKYI